LLSPQTSPHEQNSSKLAEILLCSTVIEIELKLGFAWLGFVWLCLALFGFAWLCSALLGLPWLCLALLGFALLGLA
jgi:hypothetical protein